MSGLARVTTVQLASLSSVLMSPWLPLCLALVAGLFVQAALSVSSLRAPAVKEAVISLGACVLVAAEVELVEGVWCIPAGW